MGRGFPPAFLTPMRPADYHGGYGQQISPTALQSSSWARWTMARTDDYAVGSQRRSAWRNPGGPRFTRHCPGTHAAVPNHVSGTRVSDGEGDFSLSSGTGDRATPRRNTAGPR